MQRTRRTAGKRYTWREVDWWTFLVLYLVNPLICFRRRQAKLQKELADAAKEPLPIEQSVDLFSALKQVCSGVCESQNSPFAPQGR